MSTKQTKSAAGGAFQPYASIAKRSTKSGGSSKEMDEPGPFSAQRRRAAVAANPKAVTYESIDKVALITVNSDLSIGTNELLHDAWVRLNESDDRCAVITGNNNEAFAGGGEPPPLSKITEYMYMFFRGTPNHAVRLNKPLIGAVAGVVAGGPVLLPVYCDLLIAAENTVFDLPEIYFAVAGFFESLAVRIPHKMAMQLMLGGEPISAQRLHEVGFVNEIVPVGKQVEAAMKYARRIADAAPLAVSAFKTLVDRTMPRSPTEMGGAMLGGLHTLLDSEDFSEAWDAYKTGRKPVFQGR